MKTHSISYQQFYTHSYIFLMNLKYNILQLLQLEPYRPKKLYSNNINIIIELLLFQIVETSKFLKWVYRNNYVIFIS